MILDNTLCTALAIKPGVSSLSAQETLVRLLGQNDPLEKGTATYSSFLELPWWLRQ